MAKCKCRICGTSHNTNDAYKIVVNNKSQYYCSQEEYEKDLARKKKAAEDKNKVYNLICDMFGYDIQNTQFFAEWVLWNKLKTNDIIYKYLRENEDYLQEICDKSFDSEYQRIRYFSAVLKNSLMDFVPKVEVVEQPKVIVEEHYETKYKAKTRQALEDFEEDDDDE